MCTGSSSSYLQIMEGVGFQDPEQLLLALLKAELRMLREGAVDVPLDHLLHLFLPDANLAECVVATALRVHGGDWPGHLADSLQQPCRVANLDLHESTLCLEKQYSQTFD